MTRQVARHLSTAGQRAIFVGTPLGEVLVKPSNVVGNLPRVQL